MTHRTLGGISMSLSQPRCRRDGAASPLTRLALALSLAAVLSEAAHAQAPAASASAASDAAPSERARRDAEKVFQWIRIHSDKPRKAASTSGATERSTAHAPVKKAARTPDSGPAVTVPPAPVVVAPASPEREPAPVVAASPLPLQDSVKAAAAPTPASVEEDEVLYAIHKSEPEFPANLMRTLRKGMVQVAFTVQPDGSVAQPRVLSSTHPRLAQTAVATVSQWRFQPLRHAQDAVVDLGFNLD